MGIFRIAEPSTPCAIGLDGIDHRREVEQVTDPRIRVLARSVACLIDSNQLIETSTGYSLSSTIPTVGERYRVPPEQAYAGQPVLGNATALLVGPKWIMTAGHCMYDSQGQQLNNYENLKIVFDFTVTNGNVNRDFERDSVYGVKRVVAYKFDGNSDWALIKLDRPVQGRDPLRIDFHSKARAHRRVIMIGHPSGMPAKVTEGVLITRDQDGNLITDINAFKGNSGSPCFDAKALRLCGILVRSGSQSDYLPDGTIVRTATPAGCQATYGLDVVERYLQAVGATGILMPNKYGGGYSPLSQKGKIRIQIQMAQWFENGEHGLPRSSKLANELYKKAAQDGCKSSALRMGNHYEQLGRQEKAFTYLRFAANAGDTDALYRVGIRRRDGIGVERSEEIADRCFRLAAEKGHRIAQDIVARRDLELMGAQFSSLLDSLDSVRNLFKGIYDRHLDSVLSPTPPAFRDFGYFEPRRLSYR
ncbi:MAG: trypsin-like peptidase domain-containing protein [Chlamydiales bacterium]